MPKYNKAQRELIQKLEQYETCGIPLSIDGRAVSPYEIAEIICVCEENSYMADYVVDENGELVQICFDKVLHY